MTSTVFRSPLRTFPPSPTKTAGEGLLVSASGDTAKERTTE